MSSIASTTAGLDRTLATIKRFSWLLVGLIVCALGFWGAWSVYQKMNVGATVVIPTVKVQQGDVSLPVFATGFLRGGNSQTLTAPMTGGSSLHIVNMKINGEPVKAGEVVVEFDTTDQEYALKESQADMAEAEQHIVQANSQYLADQEDARYELSKAKSDLELAELEARKNPILSGIVAKQNDLAVAVARDRLTQLQQDVANREATGHAGIEMQEAARAKAEAKIKSAQENITAMTLKAERDGYFAIRQASSNDFGFGNRSNYQIGDSVNPGMAVAEIPDLSHWDVVATVGETDRGHLSQGDHVLVSVIALPGKRFRGHVSDLGATTGSYWNPHFECKITLDEQSPDLRPGMSTRVEITAETVKNALWLPAQALFESDGKMFVYAKEGKSFARKDVTLVRRNETRVILKGVNVGQEVALANPTDATQKKEKAGASPLQALPK